MPLLLGFSGSSHTPLPPWISWGRSLGYLYARAFKLASLLLGRNLALAPCFGFGLAFGLGITGEDLVALAPWAPERPILVYLS